MKEAKPSFQVVWNRILELEGEEFDTKTGKPFTYRIDGNTFYPSRTEYNISIRNFEKAYEIVPFEGPGVVNRTIRGPAYVWAVLHDRRISKGEW